MKIYQAASGRTHPRTAHPRLGLARVALGRGRPEEALTHAEDALRILEGAHARPTELARARFVLAKALAASGDDRALAVAEQARDDFLSANGLADDEEAEVEAWLADHR